MTERRNIMLPEQPEAVLVVVHGMQEHHERYRRFAQYLCDRNIAVITYDLPGHGKDLEEGEYGWFGKTAGWQAMADTVTEQTAAAKEMADVPVYLLGHSMGTMIIRTWLKDHDRDIDGCILIDVPAHVKGAKAGRALCAAMSLYKEGRRYSAFLDHIAAGQYNTRLDDPKTPYDWLSYNEDNVQSFIDDPACGKSFTVKGYDDLLYGMEDIRRVKRSRTNKDLPLLLMYGKDDPCAGFEKGGHATAAFLKRAGYRNLVERAYDNKRHEILNENGCEEVFSDIAVFILRKNMAGMNFDR